MSIIFCGKQFHTPLLNASGNWVCDESQIANLYNELHLSGVVLKTCTINSREGNPWPNFIDQGFYCINNMGLPNRGFNYYANICMNYINTSNENKAIILSIDGSNLEDTVNMLTQYSNMLHLYSQRNELVEINLSCPNIKQSNGKPIAMSQKLLTEFLETIFKTTYINLKIGLKLPPYLYEYQIKNIAAIINKYPVNFVTCCNTIPNAQSLNPYFKGGVSGIKEFSLANVIMFRKQLQMQVEIIGCGGIKTADDVKDYLKCGAKLVQIGTEYIRDTNIFNSIACKL